MPNIKSIFHLSLFLSVHCTVLLAQPEAPNKIDSKGQKQGAWSKTYENGSIAYTAEFKNDKPIGLLTRYYEDGSLQAELYYTIAGKARAKLFYPETGSLLAQGNYINQERDSTWNFFASDSTLTSRENFESGKRQGLSTIFYPDGSIAEKAIYDGGLKNGAWEQYFENGNPKLKATVTEGVNYDGKYTSYYDTGREMMRGSYQDGRKESSWYHFHEDGSIDVIYVYRGGKVVEEHPQNGVFDTYYKDDIKRSEYTYKKGVKDGPFKEYYDQGEWIEEEVPDEYGGTRKVQKLHNIQLRQEGKFKDGQLHGEVITYSEKGKVIAKERYDMGKLIE